MVLLHLTRRPFNWEEFKINKKYKVGFGVTLAVGLILGVGNYVRIHHKMQVQNAMPQVARASSHPKANSQDWSNPDVMQTKYMPKSLTNEPMYYTARDYHAGKFYKATLWQWTPRNDGMPSKVKGKWSVLPTCTVSAQEAKAHHYKTWDATPTYNEDVNGKLTPNNHI